MAFQFQLSQKFVETVRLFLGENIRPLWIRSNLGHGMEPLIVLGPGVAACTFRRELRGSAARTLRVDREQIMRRPNFF